MSTEGREIRFERLRPAQINAEMAHCPLVFVPIGPLEYHGPHMPVGTDPLVATRCALEACGRLGKGVVFPTIFWGTERERPAWMLESLGLDPRSWVVGMDFPTAQWKSHYAPEHVFGLVVATQIEALIAGGYRVIMLVNGHGATNHIQTLMRLSAHYTAVTSCTVAGIEPIADEPPAGGYGGHADLGETAVLLYHARTWPEGGHLVDLGALPPRAVPIHYRDFSVVDSAGFSRHPDPQKVVHDDPRDATVEIGKRVFEGMVVDCVKGARAALAAKGLDG
jgi:creatinine amidohydrolase